MNELRKTLEKQEATRLRFKIIGMVFGVLSATSPIWSLPFSAGQGLGLCMVIAALLLLIALIFRGIAVSARNAAFQTRVALAFEGAKEEQVLFFADQQSTFRRRGFIFGFISIGSFAISNIISWVVMYFAATTHQIPLNFTMFANPIVVICQIVFPICGLLGLSFMAREIRARKYRMRISEIQTSQVSPE